MNRCYLALGSLWLCVPALLASERVRFEAPERYALGHVAEPIAFGDLNGDARVDIVIANTAADDEPGGDSVSVLLGSALGRPQRGGDFPAGDRPEWIALGDFNGDQNLDVVAANFGGSTVAVLLGDGAGGFGAPTLTPVDGAPRCVLPFDSNQDGTLDLVSANFDGNTVSVFLGAGTGSFLQVQNLPAGEGPEVLALARLNADEHLDLVTANALGNTVSTFLNDGNGRFTTHLTVPVDLKPRFVKPADLDGDGLDDLIVACTLENTVVLLKNTGAGLENAGRIAVDLIGETLRDPVYLALEDVTGDGLPDLLVTWARSDTLTVHPGTSTPFTFDPPAFLTTGNTPVGVGATDLDADGKLDVVVSTALADACEIFLTATASAGVVVDNGTPGATPQGAWVPSEAPCPYGSGSLFSKDGTRFRWQADLPEPGLHEAMIWWTITTSRSTTVPVEVAFAGGRSTSLVDQRTGIGIWHSLGVFDFQERGEITLTAPLGEASASADAVRFRRRGDLEAAPPRGQITAALQPQPASIELAGDRRFLALHGTLTVTSSAEAEEWTGLVLAAVGTGDEVAEIETLALHVDSDQDGSFDESDRRLGDELKFGSELRALTFLGFTESIPSAQPLHFFVVCKLIPAAAGGLQLEASSFLTASAVSRTPSVVVGAPLRGYVFPETDPVQLPSDGNQDGDLNIADPVHLLGFLFQGSVTILPCGDGTALDPGNLKLLDANGDGKMDLSDPVRLLNYLFAGAEPPVLGKDCLALRGCPDNAAKCSP